MAGAITSQTTTSSGGFARTARLSSATAPTAVRPGRLATSMVPPTTSPGSATSAAMLSACCPPRSAPRTHCWDRPMVAGCWAASRCSWRRWCDEGQPVTVSAMPQAIPDGAWRQLALSDEEHRQIVKLLGREPTMVELGMFGSMWSEHRRYKHSRTLFSQLPTEAPWVVRGLGADAGALDVGGGLAAVFQVESHDPPSAVGPLPGAASGVGGIVRDIFTVGARPV